MGTYYLCKRCNIKYNVKSEIIKHLKKKNKCQVYNLEILKLSDNDILKLSIEPLFDYDDNQIKNLFRCKYCTKLYSSKYNLDIHIKNSCKKYKNENINKELNNEELIKELNNEELINKKIINKKDNIIELINEELIKNQNINNEELNNNLINTSNFNTTNNTTNNITNNTNNTNNIINIENNFNPIINININGFNENWNTDHISDCMKTAILACQHKFSELLKEVLENIINLNVIIDKESQNGFIYNNDKKKFEIMNKDKIIEKTMSKLKDQLLNLTQNSSDNRFTIDTRQLNTIQRDIISKFQKYNDSNKNKKKEINEVFYNIFDNKKKESLNNYDKIKPALSGY